MAPIEVYGMSLSAPCRIVNMTAECLGLEYEFKVVDLMAGEHMKPEFLAMNPQHNIPTMKDGDFIMNESRAIAGYLATKYGAESKLYPTDAETRAKVDQRLYFDMGVFYKAFGECVYPVMFGGDKPGQDKFDKLKEVLGWLETFVADDKFAAGTDSITIGDLALLATYSTMKASELADVDLASFPNTVAWYEKCVKLVPNYEKANGEGCAAFGGFYKSDWSKCFRKWESVSGKSLTRWAVVYCMKDEQVTKEFLNALYKVAPSLGMTIKPPKMSGINDYRASTYLTSLDKVLELKPELVMVVVPNNKGEHYAAIKKKLCLDVPTPSQVVTATVLNKPKGLMSVATKVAVQMNCKLGGEPWAVKMPLKDTMVIGYDTYHDTLSKGRSVGAVVASLNDSMTKYVSIANIHTNSDQELHDNLCPAIVTALRKYNDVNGRLPVRIIIYRDGVGDGQIPYVMEHEVKSIRDTLLRAGLEEKDLKFTFIVVSKKINTKILKKEGTSQSNPPSGTIVDDVVTLPERYDFFLVSQSVNQGTVNPTSYNVIHDSSGLEPDKVQRLTYKLAHLYYNWPGTVRVPAPCQYAHKLAFLVGETLHNTPKGGLENNLYYL